MDATIGVQFMSRRGVLERGEFRAKPFENTSISYTYFGVDDRGLLNPMAPAAHRAAEQQRVKFNLCFAEAGGSSLITSALLAYFRLAFADSIGEAVNSEVRSAIFLTK